MTVVNMVPDVVVIVVDPDVDAGCKRFAVVMMLVVAIPLTPIEPLLLPLMALVVDALAAPNAAGKIVVVVVANVHRLFCRMAGRRV